MPLITISCCYMYPRKGVDKTCTLPWTSPPPLFWTLVGTPQFIQGKKETNYKFKLYTVCVVHTTASFTVYGSFVRSERRSSPSLHAFPSSRLVFLRGVRNFLAISYLDNSAKLVIFKFHGLPPFCFPPSYLGVSPDQDN